MDQNTMQMFGAVSDVMQRNTHVFGRSSRSFSTTCRSLPTAGLNGDTPGPKRRGKRRPMCSASTPVECFDEYQKWMAGAVERLIADGLAANVGSAH